MQKNHGFIAFALLICAGLAACTTTELAEPTIQETNYFGSFNTISGKLSDGSEMTGVSWFRNSGVRGEFCLQNKEMVCSGTYSANLSRVIQGSFTCSNGVTGSYTTERIRAGDLLRPINASATLSDGRTGTATFAVTQRGEGTTICFR